MPLFKRNKRQPEPEPEPEPAPEPEPPPPPPPEPSPAPEPLPPPPAQQPGAAAAGDGDGRELAPREVTMAVWDNDVEAVRRLVRGERAASAYEDMADGTSLLLLACQQKYEDIAMHLIAEGANVNACSVSDSYSPLFLAVRGGCIDAAEALLQRGADVEHECTSGLTALGAATQLGDGELMQLLLDAGASRDGGHPTPLALATASLEEAAASNHETADGARSVSSSPFLCGDR
jgi:ankyrin repeat protein